MKLNTIKLSTILLLTLFISGCVGQTTTWKREPYKVPNESPYATLNSGIVHALKEGETISIETPLDDCETIKTKHELKSGVLFSFKAGDHQSKSSIRVPANQPFYIQYWQAGNNQFCLLHEVVKFEAGKTYTLVGGFHMIKGVIPILFDKQGCGLGVIDDKTNKLIPYSDKLCAQ